MQKSGFTAFHSILNFGQCFKLETVQRAEANDNDAASFLKIKQATITGEEPPEADLTKLWATNLSNIGESNTNRNSGEFADAIEIVPFRAMARETNYKKIADMPGIIEIKARETGKIDGD